MRFACLNTTRALLLSALSLAAIGQAAARAATDRPETVRGTISNVSGNTLKVTESTGRVDNVTLTNNASIAVVHSASLSDIKPGNYVGVAAKPKPDGTLEALEVHIFPPSMRGVGEGTRSWDLASNGSMTNGTVAKVDVVTATGLTVAYRGREKTISIAPTTKIVALSSGERNELKPGAEVSVPIEGKQPDGTLQASRINVGSHNVPPPM
jgi:Cu/Ag efflux protein CusF